MVSVLPSSYGCTREVGMQGRTVKVARDDSYFPSASDPTDAR